MLRFRSLMAPAITAVLSGCAGHVRTSDLVSVSPQDVVQISGMISSFKAVVRDIGRYDVSPPKQRRDCPANILAYPSKVELTYQEATNVTLAGNGSGNIPLLGFILTPSITGSNSKISTTSQTILFSFASGDFQVHHSLRLDPTVSTTSVEAVTNDTALRQALENIIQGYLNSDHSKPCTQPGDVVMTTTFNIENKGSGGLDINFLAAKVGGSVAVTNSVTQTAKITFSFQGSSTTLF